MTTPTQTTRTPTQATTPTLTTPEARDTPERLSFLALGDSHTIGESVAVEGRWPVQLARRLQEDGIDIAEPEIIARTGWATGQLLAAIDAAGLTGPYSLVTLLIGVNNQFRGLDVDDYRVDLGDLLQQAFVLSGGEPLRVIVLSIPDWGVTPFAKGADRSQIAGEIDLFNAVKREETARTGATFVDITPISRKAETDLNLLAGDGLHPSGEMYKKWTDLVLPVALELLAAR